MSWELAGWADGVNVPAGLFFSDLATFLDVGVGEAKVQFGVKDGAAGGDPLFKVRSSPAEIAPFPETDWLGQPAFKHHAGDRLQTDPKRLGDFLFREKQLLGHGWFLGMGHFGPKWDKSGLL